MEPARIHPACSGEPFESGVMQSGLPKRGGDALEKAQE